ncbi:MAG: PD40 domain-containing protein [Planctomycetes bacterium]|nr:PD40 domain-containing protein [Planctomycetota bacterium]
MSYRPLAVAAPVLFAFTLAGCPQPPADDGLDSSQAIPATTADDAAEPDTPQAPGPVLLSPGDRVSGTSAELRWGLTERATHYSLYLGKSEDPPLLINILGTQYDVADLAPCAAFYWRVEATTPDGVVSSAVATFRTGCPSDWPVEPAYPAPANEALGVSSEATLHWAPVERAERYEVYFGDDADPPLINGSDGAMLDRLPEMRDGKRYYWRVEAINEFGRRSSRVWTFTTTATPNGPPMPSLIFPGSGAKDLPTRIRLEWSASRGAVGYAIYLGTTSDPPLLGESDETQWIISTAELALGATYYWRVEAIGDAGVTSTRTSKFHTAGDPQAPLAPDEPFPGNGATDVPVDVVLQWTEVANADEYEVYLDADLSSPLVGTVSAARFVPDQPLEAGRVYEWRVVAQNEMGALSGPTWRFVTRAAAPGGGGEPTAGGECGRITRVSVRSGGGQSAGGVQHPSISADGSRVVFAGFADDLVPGDTNGVADVFLHDRNRGTTVRVSVDSAGGQATAACEWPAISADGRWIAFQTTAALVSADTNGRMDVYLHDYDTHQTQWVSFGGNGPSSMPDVSADGRYVAFMSAASDLVPGDTNGVYDIFVRDMTSGVVKRVSVARGNVQGDGPSETPAISDDGRVVAFATKAANFGSGGNGSKVAVHHQEGASLVVVSTGGAGLPSIAGDGASVAFIAKLAGDSTHQIYVAGTTGGALTLASRTPNGSAGDMVSWLPALSGDGRYVAFSSLAGNLGGVDEGLDLDLFRFDMQSGDVQRLSLDPNGAEANGNSLQTAISAAADVAFVSGASNLIAGDTNGANDAFVIDCP